MTTRWLGLSASKEGVTYVDVEVPDDEDEPIVVLADDTWKVQKGDRAAAYSVLHQQCADYIRENDIEAVYVKASAVTGKGTAKLRLRQPPQSCLFHSDRGSQYCSYDYQKKLQAHGLRPSMSGKGNCYDNASVETFFKSLKAELIWRQTWPTRRQAEAAIFRYINGFYNTRRRHSYLGGISPLAFEAKVA